MNRPGAGGVTVTMIVNRLASDQLEVTRSMIRRLADDINRGVAERVEPGLYACASPVTQAGGLAGSKPGEHLR